MKQRKNLLFKIVSISGKIASQKHSPADESALVSFSPKFQWNSDVFEAVLCRHMLVYFICVEEHNTHTQQIAVFERMTLKYYLHTPTSRNQQGLSHTKFWKKDYHAPNFGSREGESKPLEFTVSCNCQFWRSAYVNCTGQNYKLISRSIFPQTS